MYNTRVMVKRNTEDVFIRLMGNNEKAPTRKYLKYPLEKCDIETYKLWLKYCWFPHLAKYRSEDAKREAPEMGKRKIMLFQIQAKRAYKNGF